ncbi:MAG: methyltransferase [Albidovulum sp.]
MDCEFRPDELTDDGFLDGRLKILQPREGYRASMDPVLLAAAVRAKPGESVLELGCGVGVASLCLASRVSEVKISGVEMQSGYATLARQNAARNGFVFDVHTGDVSDLPARLRAMVFDQVIANPPYFPGGKGTPADDEGREFAQRESTPLADWIATGLRRLRPGGWLTMIQAADRLPDLLVNLGQGVGNIGILPISSRVGRPAGRVILRVRKDGRTPLSLAAPLILHDGPRHIQDGDDLSALARAVLRDGAAITF